ncbi:cytochrome-c oxidase, cbb3-type subunit III [Permianibacter sp. IMCC34836]|uniref:cytochrome-c oxidase, cbb3-type subunit III n=1 Tax=Permianibacter fluminis TaxID=2738515 RepID=UPI001557EB27|nr:cytochrome-c oxidase, cbb3-type subunit III [Permianibacter fluminis]NQD37911.1 cytochrome-c oxidase, cbb3-type subunit III [Permianibacter fluminis]
MSLTISLYIMALVVLNIGGCWWLLAKTKNLRADEDANGKVQHSYDGIEEYNKPLPRWWLWLFYITIFFAIGYLVLYPGFGHLPGVLGWSQAAQHEQEVKAAEEKVAPLYAGFAAKSVTELSQDPAALAVGSRLFGNNCATCHGADAKGAPGFPNLTDKDWIYGGDADTIKLTITGGRQGMMPAFGSSLDEPTQLAVRHYVLSLSGRDHDKDLAGQGKATFETICAACHGLEGKGNPMLGALNLTDDVWLYGGTQGAIADTIKNGRNGVMPAHGELLGESRIHVLAAYVLSLSAKQ